MKENLQKLFNIIIIIILVLSLWQNVALKRYMQSYDNNLNNILSGIERQINGIRYDVANQLKEESNYFSKIEYNYDDVNIENGTVKVKFEVIPKEYTKDLTKVFINVAGNQEELVYSNGVFSNEFEISILDETQIDTLKIVEGDLIKSQEYTEYLQPRYQFFPTLIAHLNYGLNGHTSKDKYILNLEGTIDIFVENNYDNNKNKIITDVDTVVMIDGEIVDIVKLELDEISSISKNINSKYEIPFGSEFEIYVQAVDTYGIKYNKSLLKINVDEKGNESTTAESEETAIIKVN